MADPYPTADVTRLSGYNNNDYDASTNPLGMDAYGYAVNLVGATSLASGVVAVAQWIVSFGTDFETLAAISADLETLADIEDGTVATNAISGLAAISGNVTTVAGISANVTAVAGISANVTTVAGLNTEIPILAGLNTEIAALGAVAATDIEAAANSLGLVYAYDGTGTTDVDPTAGKARFNNATLGSATELYLDNVDNWGADQAVAIDEWDNSSSTTKGTLKVWKLAEPAVYATFRITGSVVDGTGYRKITLTPVDSAGAFTDTDVIALGFTAKGDKGDAGSSGSIVAKARFATTANVDLAGGGLAATTTHDGVTAAENDVVLVWQQTDPAENGLYLAPASGAASRVGDFDTYDEIANCVVNVSEGTTYADTSFRCTSNEGGTLGTTALTFVRRPIGPNLTAAEKLEALSDIGHGTFAETTAPSTAANEGKLYTKDSGTQPELNFREESDGDEVQITRDGAVVGDIVHGAVTTTTGGTEIDWTPPSWAKRITLLLSGVSTNGTSNWLVQLGDSGGIEATGYAAIGSLTITFSNTDYSTGAGVRTTAANANIFGKIVLEKFSAASNRWMITAQLADNVNDANFHTTSTKELSAALTTVRLTTVGGTDTFDAVNIGVMYE